MESSITVIFSLDEEKHINKTRVVANCSHRDLVCAAMFLLNEAANRVNSPENEHEFPDWITDAFNSQIDVINSETEDDENA